MAPKHLDAIAPSRFHAGAGITLAPRSLTPSWRASLLRRALHVDVPILGGCMFEGTSSLLCEWAPTCAIAIDKCAANGGRVTVRLASSLELAIAPTGSAVSGLPCDVRGIGLAIDAGSRTLSPRSRRGEIRNCACDA